MLEERADPTREREREYTWGVVFVVLDSGDGGGRRTWWVEERCLFFFFVSVERERETRRAEGSAWSAPRSVWYKVGCVFWVAESGGACAGGGTRRGESGRSNQHKEERVRVEEREYTHAVCGVVTVNCVKAVYICCPRCVWPVL